MSPKLGLSTEHDDKNVGDSLVEKMITTGLNNDTQVQVLSGLDINDLVINGVEVQVKGESSSGAVRSPFMPARRPSGNGGKSGTGSGAAQR